MYMYAICMHMPALLHLCPSMEVSFMCHSSGSMGFFFFLRFIYLFIYLFIICKYTEAVFRHPRRRNQISLLMVVSHHVVAGI